MASPKEHPFSCPGCGRSYQIPEDLSGARVTCEKCSTDFILPDFLQPPPQPLEPAPTPLTGSSEPILPPSFASGLIESSSHRPGNFLKSLLLLLSGAALVLALGSHRKKTAPTSSASPSHSAGAPVTQVSNPAPPPVPSTKAPASPSPAAPELQTVVAPPTAAADPDKALTPPGTPAATTAQAVPIPSTPPAEPTPGPAVSSPPPQPVPEAPAAPEAPPVRAAAVAAASAPSAAELRKNSRTALEHFLTSTTPEARLSVTLKPDKAKASVEAFHQSQPSKPLPLTELAFLTEGALPDGSSHFHLYNVFLSDQEAPIPVAVEKTADGYRVDWHAFHESYTQKLAKFCATPNDKPGRFRVVLRRAHYFGKPVPGQDTVRIAYSIEPPPRNETFYAWVDKDSLVYQEKLATGERSTWEAESYAIVELMWKGDDQRGRWIGLSRIVSDNWRND